ncbi:MAG: hypothetical protein AAFY60_16645, partial [Myxococcota bacterium]
GNASVLTSFASERVLPWITEVPSQSVAEIAAFDPADPDIAVTEAFAFVDPAVDGDLGQRIQNVGDIDGDGLDDLVASAFDGAGSPKIAIFYSSTGDLSAPVIINGPSSSLFGWRIRGGNIDGTAPNDLMITAPTTDTSDGSGSGGASGGAVYIWWGANGGIRTDSASDSRLPSIRPDVTILGEAGEFIGFDAQVADVDANDSDDVVFVSRSTFGFSGGDRARFPGAPALFYLDTSAVYTGSPAPLARPDFIIDPTSVSSGGFLELEAGDYNGDGSGKAELVVIDRFVDGTNAASGEAYVFEGGAITGRITPDIGPPVVAPLLQILRGDGRVNELIGQSHHTMANPSGSGPDWLILSTVTYDQVYVFSGTDGGLLQDAGTLSPSVSVTDNAFGIALCSNFNAASGQVDLFVTDTNPAQAAGDPARAFFFEFDGTSLVERSVVTG